MEVSTQPEQFQASVGEYDFYLLGRKVKLDVRVSIQDEKMQVDFHLPNKYVLDKFSVQILPLFNSFGPFIHRFHIPSIALYGYDVRLFSYFGGDSFELNMQEYRTLVGFAMALANSDTCERILIRNHMHRISTCN